MADALGHRARIGILIPSSNTIAQPEYEMLAPDGVTNQVTRLRPTPKGATGGNLETYRDNPAAHIAVIADALAAILPCGPQAVILSHAMDTFRGGGERRDRDASRCRRTRGGRACDFARSGISQGS